MITNALKKAIATHIKNNLDTAKVGVGGNSTSPASTDLDVDASGTPTIQVINSSENIIEAKVTVSGSAITGKVLRELGLFKTTSTGPPVEREMWARFNFSGIGPFTSTEVVEFFVVMEVE